ncbi:alpha/beta hydrolase [Fibrobacter sp.]|uniref:poly(ethylene terephthalate) hydrolase family protein n=1 Tax=Fibrobacter sp. TaxID=35828 RepID=UPI0025B97D3D|nr:alpha/beta hydrolase [Fibrobacter sp.]MBR3072635.1 alpha/beta hydrolase [Fibrobacter sp.]
MKSKILKGIIVASAIAFVNCSDDATAPDFNNQQSTYSSSVELLALSSSSVETPASSAADLNLSSAEVQVSSSSDALTSSVTEISSSSVAAPQSSSSDALTSSATAVSSSSDAPASSANSTGSSTSVPTSSATVESSSSVVSIFLAEGKEEEKDQLQVEYKENTGWDGKGILSYPKQLSSTRKHGVIVWGPGGGTEPGAYGGMIRRLASHGFVVIALSVSPGDASQAMKAIDWFEQKNKDSNDPFYQKLELTKVGCSGHSMGGLESEQAAIKDKRVYTAFLNNSGDKNGGVIKNFPKEKTAAVLYGEVGMEKPNAIKDYETATDIASCLIEMTGGPMNSEGGYGHGSGSWDGMAATIAWMRWQIGGEDFRKADFVGSTGKYIDGNILGHQGKWKTQCKNF